MWRSKGNIAEAVLQQGISLLPKLFLVLPPLCWAETLTLIGGDRKFEVAHNCRSRILLKLAEGLVNIFLFVSFSSRNRVITDS